MPTPIRAPRRVGELLVEQMRRLITDGEWPVGSRIPAEPELVSMFEVGRNTVREAVRALEHAGMLAPRRGDGTYVRSRHPLAAAIIGAVDAAQLRDLVAVRRALESEAAADAAARSEATDHRALAEALDRVDSALAEGRLDDFATADVKFHSAVVAACGNPLLVELYESVLEVMHRTHADVVAATASAGVNPHGHRDLLDAIVTGDATAARTAVHSYLDDAMRGLS